MSLVEPLKEVDIVGAGVLRPNRGSQQVVLAPLNNTRERDTQGNIYHELKKVSVMMKEKENADRQERMQLGA